VLAALSKMDGAEADALRVELVTKPHANAVAVEAALKQMTDRNAAPPAARLAELCPPYRPGVRAAARKLTAQVGGPEPAPFDPVKALRSPPVQRIMDAIAPLLPEPLPPDAELVAVTVRTPIGRSWSVVNEKVVTGWLLKRDADTVEILTPRGWRETYRR